MSLIVVTTVGSIDVPIPIPITIDVPEKQWRNYIYTYNAHYVIGSKSSSELRY